MSFEVEFAAAFVAAQNEFPPIAKTRTAKIPTKTGKDYSYKYADLGDVLAAVLPVLHKHGIGLVQLPISDAGMVGVQTRLVHVSGHIEDCGSLLLSAGGTAQAAGSAMTYARRYAVCAALGVVAEDDDDGRAASAIRTPEVSGQEVDVRGTNRLKAKVVELVGADAAPELWLQALAAHDLAGDAVVPAPLHGAVEATLVKLAEPF